MSEAGQKTTELIRKRKSSIANSSLIRHEEKSIFSKSFERLPPANDSYAMQSIDEDTEKPNLIRVNQQIS